ncbi:MAG TPA: hybrid sensor histidine kinase/response regulator [Acidobacteriota bacterium]
MSGGGEDLSGFSMLDLFREEVKAQAAILTEGLLALERNPGQAEGIDALMRAAHSIKGAARIVQIDAAVKVAHVMEDCFVAAQSGKIALQGDHVDTLLRGVDMLSRIGEATQRDAAAWEAEHNKEIEQLVASISEVLSSSASAGAAETIRATTPPRPQMSAPANETIAPAGEKLPPSLKKSDLDKPVPPRDRVLRVTAQSLDRLMGLAGESVVEARRLQPFTRSLLQLKRNQIELSDTLEKLRASLNEFKPADRAGIYLAEARQKVDDNRQLLNERLAELEALSRRSENTSERLYREVIGSRMRPFADGVQGFPRLVRDLAKKLGKRAKLEIIGESTEVDRDILDKLESPLNHLIRNAADHGIEPEPARRAAGKQPEGTIRLEARHVSGMLSITVSDDGQGIEPEHLRQKILNKNLVTPEMAAQLSQAELMEFLFLPGFSTAEAVTEISGRGVGLDAVHSMVQEVGGMLRAVSQPGKGMSFHLQLPITLSVIRALLVEVSGENYAFPLTRIDRALRVHRTQIEILENRQYFLFDGQSIGLVGANQVLELEESKLSSEELPIVVISDRSNRYGVVVDRLLGQHDLVVQPLDPRLGKVADISAAAVMEDGSPVLIVDADDLVRSIHNMLSGGRLSKIALAKKAAAPRKHKRILVVDDSITVREVERKVLQNKGYEVEIAVDGIEAWNAVRSGDYDLVVTDVDMPRLNGIELVKLIKRDARLDSLPVMIVSYKDREEDRLRGLDAGADYYLTKSSFHDESLVDAVVDLIGEA